MIFLVNETAAQSKFAHYSQHVYSLWQPFKRAEKRGNGRLSSYERRSVLRLTRRCLLDMANLFRIHVRDGTIPDSEAMPWRAGSEK